MRRQEGGTSHKSLKNLGDRLRRSLEISGNPENERVIYIIVLIITSIIIRNDFKLTTSANVLSVHIRWARVMGNNNSSKMMMYIIMINAEPI